MSFYLMVYPFKVKEFRREKSLMKGIGSAYNHKTLYIYMQISKNKENLEKQILLISINVICFLEVK